MNCSKCNAYYDETAQYCAQCGTQTLYNVKRGKTDASAVSVWLSVGFLIAVSLFYRVISMISNSLYRNGKISDIEKLSTIYPLSDFAFLVIKLGICGYIIFTIKNTSIRIAVGLIGAFYLVLYVFDLVMKFVNG